MCKSDIVWSAEPKSTYILEYCVSHYNLRSGGCNLVQPSYNNWYYHNYYTYKVTYLQNNYRYLVHILNSDLNDFHKNLDF